MKHSETVAVWVCSTCPLYRYTFTLLDIGKYRAIQLDAAGHLPLAITLHYSFTSRQVGTPRIELSFQLRLPKGKPTLESFNPFQTDLCEVNSSLLLRCCDMLKDFVRNVLTYFHYWSE